MGASSFFYESLGKCEAFLRRRLLVVSRMHKGLNPWLWTNNSPTTADLSRIYMRDISLVGSLRNISFKLKFNELKDYLMCMCVRAHYYDGMFSV